MEYGGGTQNWTITRDNNGWIYAANNSGLLQFDGYSWHLFSNGMIIRTAYHDGKERIYVGAFRLFLARRKGSYALSFLIRQSGR